MAEENKVRDTADAIKGIVESVPIYQDLAQPALQELGKGLQTVAKTVHIALAPVAALVWGYDQIRDLVSTRVSEKLRNVPTERIQSPEPNVAGPALEALKYTGHQEPLRELYANLLASSIDSKTARTAHPSFVEMIKQMTPDEAQIMRLMSSGLARPFLDLRLQNKDSQMGYWIVRYCSFVPGEAGCSYPDLGPSYLLNLQRLGLLELREEYSIRSHQETYNLLCEVPDVKALGDKYSRLPGQEVMTIEGAVLVTALGEQFCAACIVEGQHA